MTSPFIVIAADLVGYLYFRLLFSVYKYLHNIMRYLLRGDSSLNAKFIYASYTAYAQSLNIDNSLNSSEHETKFFHRGNDWVSLFSYRA